MDEWLNIVRRAWTDVDFKKRLLDPAETNTVLEEYNLKVPDGVTFVVKEDSRVGERYLVLPPQPDPGDASLNVDSFERDVESGDPGF